MGDSPFLPFALTLADAAGEILRGCYRKPLPVEVKSDASPVTAADRDVEAAIRALIERKYPEHGIFGEEHGRRNESASYQWVIDPIDGTRSFIAGFLTFTTLIALVKDGVPVLGIIDQPITGERWVGQSGHPSTYAGMRITARNLQQLSHAVITTTSNYHFLPEEVKRFDNLRKQCGHATLGGDAYAYAMLASGRVDIVVDAHMQPYDFCALPPVIEGAGGVITDWQGNPLTLSSSGHTLAASNKTLHAQALELLS